MAGKIWVVGFGPGPESGMTFEAHAALKRCQVVVGYKGYIEQIMPLLSGKQVIATGMTEEVERGRKALELARQGLQVAVVSSGDAGVYGMAALVLEVLEEDLAKKAGPEVEVQVVAGVTALLTAAAALGAPISHDFCAISLSDLLTPWPLIEKRLQAAADGDFVVALYNPKSKKRDWQLGRACEILLGQRLPATPVGIVTQAGREGQAVQITDLGSLAQAELGMLSMVLIGNSQTRVSGPRLLTPRGYSGKYDLTEKGGALDKPRFEPKRAN
jgi:precorrin-3B C17-methyltransferase